MLVAWFLIIVINHIKPLQPHLKQKKLKTFSSGPESRLWTLDSELSTQQKTGKSVQSSRMICATYHWYAQNITDIPPISLIYPQYNWYAQNITDMTKTTLTCPQHHWPILSPISPQYHSKNQKTIFLPVSLIFPIPNYLYTHNITNITTILPICSQYHW